MKLRPSILLALLFSALTVSIAQNAANNQVGKVTYMEGQATLAQGSQSLQITINTPVYYLQTIKTAAKSIVEITWSNGAKTTVEPSSIYLVKDLYDQSNSKALAQSESVFSGFKKVFRSANESRRAEEGGIRRSKVVADSLPKPDQLYWKEDKEISFEEASAIYEKGDYVKSVWAFKTFLDQKPMDSMAKYATFALGHSYLMVNNQVKAREVFEKFIVKYSNDDLKNQAEMVLAKIPASN